MGIVESDIHSPQSRVQRNGTFKSDEVFEKLKIEGYKLELPDTWEIFGQARIIAYVRDDLNYKRQGMKDDTDLPNITLEVGLGREKKTLLNLFYREWTGGISGEKSHASQLDRLTRQINYWQTLYSQNRDVVCMGDANLCALTWNNDNSDPATKVLSNCLQEHLLEESSHQIVKNFTRSEMSRSGVSRSCLDHIYTNSPSKCDEPIVEAAGNSDHLAIVFNKFTKELQSKPQAVLKRSYVEFDPHAFLLDIQNCCINEAVTSINEVNEAAYMFKELFTCVLNRHAPLKIFQSRVSYVPFLKKETKILMKERNTLKEEATKSGDKDLLNEYKIIRNKVRHAISKDQSDYYKQKFLDENMSLKQSWNVVNNFLGKSSNKSPSKINFENKVISNPKALAAAFSRIFEKKVADLRAQTNIEPKIDPIERLKSWMQNTTIDQVFELKQIDCLKLRKIINKIKPSRSHGLDFIDSFSIKLAYPVIEDAILHLVNLSISQKLFANDWKYQLVLPLHKKNDTLDGNNYRPVSHIIEIGKIVEYVVYEQVYDFFKDQNLFHQNHHGFLRNRSTATALIQLYDLWLSAAENRELSAALLLDLSAAFDIVDHDIFLKKLQVYGFSEGAVHWFKSYLESRTQVIQVQTKFSDPQQLGSYAVPQGSILGPLIFLIFNNDFPACSVNGSSVLYADDNTDNVSSKNVPELQEKIQFEADRSTDWVQDNRMVCSGPKTKLLIMGTSQLRNKLLNGLYVSVNVCGHNIVETESEPLLGLTVNNKLTWSNYLHGEQWRVSGNKSGLISQLSQRVGLLSQISKFMSRSKIRLISNGLFYSKLLYCLQVYSHVWGLRTFDTEDRRFNAFTKDDNKKLQILQNKVLRLISGLPLRTPTATLLENTGGLSVQQLTAFMTLVTAKKAIISGQPGYLAEKLSLDHSVSKPRTRQYDMLSIKSHLSLGRSGFFCQSSTLLNQLPRDLRNCEDIRLFKQDVKKWIRQNIQVRP